MTQQHPSTQPQRAAIPRSRAIAERLVSPIAFLASGYFSIVAGLLLFSMSRIGRLTTSLDDPPEF